MTKDTFDKQEDVNQNYLTFDDMGTSTGLEAVAQLDKIAMIDTKFDGKDRKSLRVTFLLPEFGNKACNYFCSAYYSPSSKFGKFLAIIYNDLPDQININDVLTRGKDISYHVLVERKKYPTITKVTPEHEGVPDVQESTEVPPLQQIIKKQQDPEPTPEAPPEQPQPVATVRAPTPCGYCGQPLPSNPELYIQTQYEGKKYYLHPACNTAFKEAVGQ